MGCIVIANTPKIIVRLMITSLFKRDFFANVV